MDITKFEETHGLEKGEITRVLRKKYPTFSKTNLSLARRPKVTGVRLTSTAESYLKSIYEPLKEKSKSPYTSVRISKELYARMLDNGLSVAEIIERALEK